MAGEKFVDIALRTNGPDVDAGWFNAVRLAGITAEAINVLTTNGDILFYNSGYQRLAKGSDGQVLKLASGFPSWAAEGAGSGQLSYDITTKSDDYVILDDDGYTTILVDDSSTDRVVTLPTAADNGDRVLTIKNTSTDKGKVNVDGEGGETIDGVTDIDLDFKNAFITIQCNGTAWFIIQENLTSIQKKYTITVTGANWTTTHAYGIPYRTIDGVWMLRFNIHGTTSNTDTNYALAVTGITIDTGITLQACYGGVQSGANFEVCQARGSTNDLRIIVSAAENDFWLGGDISLDAKPTFVE